MNKFKFSIAIIRGAHLNPFEMQNYSPLMKSVKINTFSSLLPLGICNKLPNTKLFSLADLPKILTVPLPYYSEKILRYLANRTLGDQHLLFNLKNKLTCYDILHVADPYYYYSYQAALVKANNPNKRLVCTVWETKAHNNEKTKAKKRIKNFVIKHTDLFICHTKKARLALIQDGAKKNKIIVLKLGVNTKLFKPTTKKGSGLLFVGRFVEEKGILILLKAFMQISKQFPQLTLTLVGKGKLKKLITKKVLKYKLNKQVKIVNTSYKQVKKYYQNADIFILPSLTTTTWEEQYSMALIEAMASGLAIIATKSGAIPEVLNNKGILIDENRSDLLVEKIKLLVNNPELKAKYATQARANAVQYYDSYQYAKKILKIYAKLISCHSC